MDQELATAQGTRLTESFYWDLSDRTRAFTGRVGVAQARASGRAVVERMKQMPVDDDVLTHARVREDGRVVSDAYLFEVKRPADSRSEWDLYTVAAKLGPDEAWRPMAEGGCPLVKA